MKLPTKIISLHKKVKFKFNGVCMPKIKTETPLSEDDQFDYFIHDCIDAFYNMDNVKVKHVCPCNENILEFAKSHVTDSFINKSIKIARLKKNGWDIDRPEILKIDLEECSTRDFATKLEFSYVGYVGVSKQCEVIDWRKALKANCKILKANYKMLVGIAVMSLTFCGAIVFYQYDNNRRQEIKTTYEQLSK